LINTTLETHPAARLGGLNANRIASGLPTAPLRRAGQAGAALNDLLDLMQDRRLTRVLSHQLPEALFGEVGPEAPACRAAV